MPLWEHISAAISWNITPAGKLGLTQEGLRNHGLAVHRHPRPSPGQERVDSGGSPTDPGHSCWGLFRYCLHLCEVIRASGAEWKVRAFFAIVLRPRDGLQLPPNFFAGTHRAR